MVRRGHIEFAVAQPYERLPKKASKTYIPITNNFQRHTMLTHDMFKEQPGELNGSDALGTRYDSYPLGETVDNDHYTVKTA